MLAQRFERRSRAELAALADALATGVLDETLDGDLRRETSFPLVRAANADKSYPDEEVVPYEGAFDALVRIYETMVSWIPDDGSNDPFYSLGRAFAGKTGDSPEYVRSEQAYGAVRRIYLSEPDGRGRAYLLAMIFTERTVGATVPCSFEDAALWTNGAGEGTVMLMALFGRAKSAHRNGRSGTRSRRSPFSRQTAFSVGVTRAATITVRCSSAAMSAPTMGFGGVAPVRPRPEQRRDGQGVRGGTRPPLPASCVQHRVGWLLHRNVGQPALGGAA
ncbi:MAG: hypothetical protein OXR82_08140, partial [Gammaproteobacteria bacterium]|nr:hypothetical protein [Gammaproteobacteria bacterium]